MRKIILLALVFLFTCNFAFAAVPPQQPTKELLTKYNETRFKLESGITYRDFQSAKQELYVKTNLYLENYPDGDFNNDFNILLKAYSNTSDIWELKIQARIDFLPRTEAQYNRNSTKSHLNYTKLLLQDYPDVMSKCKEDERFGFYLDEVIGGLFGNIIDKTKNLNQKINSSY